MKTPTETTPYIYMQIDEQKGTAQCGCTLDVDSEGCAALYRCEKCVRAVNSHEDLLDALNAIDDLGCVDGTYTATELTDLIDQLRMIAREAVAKAEGK